MNLSSATKDLDDILDNSYYQRNELDRFGFSWLLADYLGYHASRPPKARCSWLHGWKWFPPTDYRYFWWDANASLYVKTHVVNHVSEREMLIERHGFRRTIVGGLPFAYALLNLNRFPGSFSLMDEQAIERDTCVFLPKSAYEQTSARMLIEEVLDDRRSIGRMVFVVFGEDVSNSSLMESIRKAKVPYIIGSCPTYKYDLLRTAKLLKQFKYLVTNSLGSHIPYSASLGLSIRISSNFRARSPAEFLRYAGLQSYPPRFFEELAWYHSKDYFFSKYANEFTADVFSGDLTDWGRFELGCSRILSKETLKTVLGWNVRGMLNANLEALEYKLRNAVLFD